MKTSVPKFCSLILEMHFVFFFKRVVLSNILGNIYEGIIENICDVFFVCYNLVIFLLFVVDKYGFIDFQKSADLQPPVHLSIKHLYSDFNGKVTNSQ